MPSIRNKLTAVAAIGAAALAGSAIANAASSGTTTTSSSGAAQTRQGPPQRDPSMGGHRADGKTERLLTGDTASKVEAAAKAKVPGGTIERVENDADTGSPYEAHVRRPTARRSSSTSMRASTSPAPGRWATRRRVTPSPARGWASACRSGAQPA